MAVMIELDTDELRNAVSIAAKANEQLSEAMELLNAVAVHNDWTCPERNAINSNTIQNRARAESLRSDAQNFYNMIKYSADRFQELESEINSSFSNVDSALGSFLSLVPSGTASAQADASGSVSGTVSQVLSDVQSNLSDMLGGLKKGADIVSFDEILSALKDN